MQINIDKVSIKIGDKTIELSLEDAKKLRDELNGAFPVFQYSPAIVIEKHVQRIADHPWYQTMSQNPICSLETPNFGSQTRGLCGNLNS